MKTIGQLFYRPIATLVMVALVLIAGMPHIAAASPPALLALTADDFNQCSVDPMWVFTNPANLAGASPKIVGQYTGESYLQMAVPAGTQATFSNTNKNAPRVMTPFSDANFELEVKFLGPISATAGGYKMQGILVRDNSNPAAPEWLRFDVNSHSTSSLDLYIGYVNPAGTLVNIFNVSDLTGSNPGDGPAFIRVNYVQATGDWTITYITLDSSGNQRTDVRTFNETVQGFDFTVTDVGLFAGTTLDPNNTLNPPPPGHTMKVDYVRLTSAPMNDDAIKLTVTKQGTGTGTVDWPMTSENQCSGNTVTLTAAPTNGSTFSGWTGAVESAAATINVQMTAAKDVIATFSGGSGLILDHFIYLPSITR